MLRSLVVAAVAVVLVALPLPPARAADHVLRFTDTLDVTTLNPMFAQSGNIQVLSEFTMAHFLRYDGAGRPHPELATEIPTLTNGGISADGKTITYRLRHDARWSDGVPFDADDVLYTFGVIRDPANPFTDTSSWEAVKSITAPDKYTAVFHLSHPYAPFAYNFFSSFSNSAVLPKHVLGASTNLDKSPYNALPVGIGPFRYTAFHRGESVEMEANPYYFRGKPKLTGVSYRIIPDENTALTQLRTGEVDLWYSIGGVLAPRVLAIADKKNNSTLTSYMSGVFFNTTHPAVSDPRVRVALRFATNRASLFEKIYHQTGVLTESVVPQISHDYTPVSPPVYDPVRAASLLDAAGWKTGADGKRAKNGVPLTVVFALPSGYAPSSATVELLRADWLKLGVTVESHEYTPAQFFGLASAGGILATGKFDAALLSQSGNPDADVTNGYACSSFPPKGFNISRYCRAEVDALLSRYNVTYDAASRARLAKQFQATIDRDAPVVITYERAFVNAFSPRLSGYHPGGFALMGDPLDLDI